MYYGPMSKWHVRKCSPETGYGLTSLLVEYPTHAFMSEA
jgi:hypothetical protein